MAFSAAAPCIIGHRGAAGLAAENTLPGFEAACHLGADAVELDVYAVDGQLIVIHDDDLDRTTNGRGPVMAQSFAFLRSLDAGNGARIPTLDEVWQVLPADVGLNIELKGPGTAAPVAAWLRDRAAGMQRERLMVSSFDHAQLRAFQVASDHRTIVAPLFHRWRKDCVEVARAFATDWININEKLLTAARMRHLSGEGLKISAYTVNSVRRAEALVRLGVHGLFTDRPDRVSRSALEHRVPATTRSADP
jgi:glycerophosphoryl diester phosphodiesterase